MPDSFYEGKDDLTAAMGFEENGITTIAFRRSLQSQEPSDHTIEETMMLIWAVGQTHGNYNHKPDSGLEKGQASILDFYRPDEVKYHGKLNRGFTMINLLTKPLVSNGFQYPLNCQDDCIYKVTWTQIGNEIEVTVTGKVKDESDWIGVGFSENNVMPQTDIIVGYFTDGNAVVKDYYSVGYSPPQEDESQDIRETSLARKDGFTIMKFKRSISTTDKVRVSFFNFEFFSHFFLV